MVAKKKIITEDIEGVYFSAYDLEAKLVDLIAQFQKIVDEHGDTASLDYGQHHAYDDSYSYQCRIYREETDDEAKKRIAKSKAEASLIKKATLERERAEFERLSKKFSK